MGAAQLGEVQARQRAAAAAAQPVRILYLTAEQWPTHRADVAVLFGKYLRDEGLVVDLVAGQAPAAAGDQEWLAGRTLLTRLGNGLMRRRLQLVRHALVNAFKAQRDAYDAMQVRDMPFVASIVLLIARAKGLRFFYWMSYPIPEGQILLAQQRGLSAGWMKFLYPFVSGHVGRFLLRRWVLSHADHVFVQTPRMQQDLEGLGVRTQRMMPVLMGVDCAAVRALPAPQLDVRLRGRRVIGYLGALDRARKAEQLFLMLALVRERFPTAVLLLVGEAEEEQHRRWLRLQAAQVGVDDAVIWAGWLPMHEGWQLIRQAEVALSMIPRGPLLDCGSPTKVPEYLALGLPVVGNDNPDQQALIQATGAGRCVPYTPEAFAAAVLELLSLPADERARMAEVGRRYVQAHRDYPRLAQDLGRRYRQLLGKC